MRFDKGWIGWLFYGAAALMLAMSIINLWAEMFPCSVLGLLFGGWIGMHPWLRRSWYRIGYCYGLADARRADVAAWMEPDPDGP